MLNSIAVMGRLTRDPELRHTQNGIAVASFSVACERDYADNDGKKQTDFLDVVAWRGTGEFAAKYFTKGQLIGVCGRLQQRQWTDKNGSKRVSAEILADHLYFAEGKRDKDARREYSEKYDDRDAPPESGDFAELEDEDGDLPF